MFAFRRVLIALLIVFLASGTLLTPGLRHRHALSEHSHQQDMAPSHAHRHSHEHSHHHRDVAHRHVAEVEPAFGDSPIDHMHVRWFGFGLTLPIAPGDSSDLADSVSEWVSLLGESIPPQVVVGAEVLAFDSLDAGTVASAIVMPACEELSAPQTISLLCGIARRERSGVLNI